MRAILLCSVALLVVHHYAHACPLGCVCAAAEVQCFCSVDTGKGVVLSVDQIVSLTGEHLELHSFSRIEFMDKIFITGCKNVTVHSNAMDNMTVTRQLLPTRLNDQ